MKKSTLLWSLLGVLALGACSESDLEGPTGPTGGKDGDRYLAVEVTNPVSRADLEGDYEKGEEAENGITSLRFYFFNNDGAAVAVDAAGAKNYVDAAVPAKDGDDMENVELKFKAVLVINTKAGGKANVNKMVAVANHGAAALGAASLSLGELQEKIGQYNVTTANNFLMTSSSYADGDGQVNAAGIKPENLCTSESAALANPVDIYIERVVAKVRLQTAWNAGMTVADATLDGQACKAVALKDKDGNAIENDGKQVYAVFTGWNTTGTADKSYLFKKVNAATAWNLGWTWNNAAFFRSYWAMNPADLTLGHISYNEINLTVGDARAYCLENAADNFALGTKSAYDPATQISNRTQAIIAAILVTVDNGVATPLSLAKWAGTDYTEEGVKTAMLNTIAKQLYTKTMEDGKAVYTSITLDHVELVSAEDAGMADASAENDKRYLTYLKLTKAAESVEFYAPVTYDGQNNPVEGKKYTTKEVNDMLLAIPGARIWKSGMTYYYTDLKHLGSEATKGQFGVVRNHIYEVKLNSVVGLGTPVFDADQDIIPQKPTDDETYIAARINVLSWRIVNNDTELEW